MTNQHESRVPLSLIGLMFLAIGVFYLLFPEAPVNIDRSSLGTFSGSIPESVVNLHKLYIGQSFTIAGAILLAAALRPR